MKTYGLVWAAVLGLCAARGLAQEYRQLSTVHDGSGRLSDNTVSVGGVDYRHVSAAGQPGGIATSASGDLANHAGFLQAVDIKRPDLDHDGDGVIDELDLDNDGDDLTDVEEVEGGSFDPNTPTQVNQADSDGDDVPDGEEAAAGTNPNDEDAFLRITALRSSGEDKVVTWTARGGKQYRVLSSDGSYAYPAHEEGSVTAEGGAAPWFETTAVFTNAATPEARSYGVRVMP